MIHITFLINLFILVILVFVKFCHCYVSWSRIIRFFS